MMLRCKEIMDLASDNLETSLPWPKRWEMKLHFLICKNCNRYVEQLRLIQKWASLMDSHAPHISLSDDARIRIQNRLEIAQDD
jgi:hypothetical protein